ncbi:MAG TPA: cobalamin-binding protein [Pyrinomonadaceae bacterium]|nr:cobalamin-binding protein [Pyrinomonadaceae bacterium]
MIQRNSKYLTTRTIALFFFALLVFSCSRPGEPAANCPNRQITDDLGRVVQLPLKVERVVSLAPNLTEIVFAVGGGDKLVGVTTFCNYPAEALKLRRVSDTLKPNIESVIALRPDVVLVSTASQLEAFSRSLEEQNIAVFVTSPNSIEDIYRSIEMIGKILETEDRAQDLTDELRMRAASVRRGSESQEPPKVFVQIDKDSLYTIGRDSYITEIVAVAGGLSATAQLATAYPNISREAAIAMNPDVIVISESEGNREPNEAFKNSPAVKNGKVLKIEADLLSRPGPRFINALEQLADNLRTKPKESLRE